MLRQARPRRRRPAQLATRTPTWNRVPRPRSRRRPQDPARSAGPLQHRDHRRHVHERPAPSPTSQRGRHRPTWPRRCPAPTLIDSLAPPGSGTSAAGHRGRYAVQRRLSLSRLMVWSASTENANSRPLLSTGTLACRPPIGEPLLSQNLASKRSPSSPARPSMFVLQDAAEPANHRPVRRTGHRCGHQACGEAGEWMCRPVRDLAGGQSGNAPYPYRSQKLIPP
jgi:hypothetical protein